MLYSPRLISPCATFWNEVAHGIIKNNYLDLGKDRHQYDFSAMRVVVPTFDHAQHLKNALSTAAGCAFIPPRISTLNAWLALLSPTEKPTTDGERLMTLYSALRQQAWLKKLFTARRNTDLFPLAQTLLALCDALTLALLPSIQKNSTSVDERWESALAQLAPSGREMVSDESQLVWSIWKSQMDANDARVSRFQQMMRLSEHADAPLLWISPTTPDVFEEAFLQAYGQKQNVLPIYLDWRTSSLQSAYASAWPEMLEDALSKVSANTNHAASPEAVSIFSSQNLEEEAEHGAQTIVDWIKAGKSRIAIIAQERVVARRMCALLARAQIFVTDETGWKLSTTRAAAALAAWFDVVTTQAKTGALLDFLKSPYLLANLENKSAQVMTIEMALRRANVSGGWQAVGLALQKMPPEGALLALLKDVADRFSGKAKSLEEWIAITQEALDTMHMRDAMAQDAAGVQVLQLLESIQQNCDSLDHPFSFAEWRAFINVQLESTSFIPPIHDKRVVMLPLNGARMRSFDAVLMVGADAKNLPSQPKETLFFANTVRRELGLDTRESRQRQQLRDFAELLHTNSECVISWQAFKNGEPNAVSPWIARLQLSLERAGSAPLRELSKVIPYRTLTPMFAVPPTPSAPSLLPDTLSASGYNSLVACPYQFFATRMLGLKGVDELSEMPKKRDFGDWLHKILFLYHEKIRDQKILFHERLDVLRDVSENFFSGELEKNAAALAYFSRWKKTIPAYVTWANEREAQGWRFAMGEQKFEKTITWLGGQITLHGRIDRVDESDHGEYAVLDYKTRTSSALKNKFKKREDHQLAFYGILLDAHAAHASYVALEPEKEKTGDAEAPNYTEWKEALGQQVIQSMSAIAQGATLAASGIASVCQYCEVRGLCRKGAW